jgi:hypothetical protein
LMHIYGQGHLGLVYSKVGVVWMIMKLFVWMQGVITKHMTTIEEMVGMDVLCSDKMRTFTLNKLIVDKNLIKVCKSWKWNIAPYIRSAKVFSCKFMFQVKHNIEASYFLHPHF